MIEYVPSSEPALSQNYLIYRAKRRAVIEWIESDTGQWTSLATPLLSRPRPRSACCLLILSAPGEPARIYLANWVLFNLSHWLSGQAETNILRYV